MHNTQTTEQIAQQTEIIGPHTTKYTYYIADTLVGTANTINKADSIFVTGLSTINFRTPGHINMTNKLDLAEMEPEKIIYETNLKALQEKGIATQGVGREIFRSIIHQAKKQNKRSVQGLIIQTSYGFYNKICQELIKEGVIQDFVLSHQYDLTIYL